MRSFVLGGVNAAAFLLCTAFLAYVISIVVPLLRHKRGPTGDPTKFAWHFLVPCLNEERVIASTVSNLFKKFPTAHIWCIDDGSNDGTHQIVSRMASRSRQVHVVTRRLPEARQGKGMALNAGWRAVQEYLPADADLDATIVGVVDADGILDRHCPEIITGPELFGDPKVSAVQILVRVVNQAGDRVPARTRLLTRMQDVEFTCVIAGMQMLRRHVGSTAMGGNGQFTRASALKKVSDVYGTPWARALLEDFELGLRILLTGGDTEYCHDTWVAQQGPPTVGRLMRQRCRWAQGLMQCFRYFLPVMRSREVSTPAALEISVFLLLPWFQLVGVVVYLVSLVVLIYYALTTTGGLIHWFGNGAWGLIPLFILFGLAPLALWGPIYRRTAAGNLSRTQAVLLGLVNWPYSYIHHVSTWWAFGRMVRARHDWKKTERLDLPVHKGPTPRPTPMPAAAVRMTPASKPARPRPAVARSRATVAGSGRVDPSRSATSPAVAAAALLPSAAPAPTRAAAPAPARAPAAAAPAAAPAPAPARAPARAPAAAPAPVPAPAPAPALARASAPAGSEATPAPGPIRGPAPAPMSTGAPVDPLPPAAPPVEVAAAAAPASPDVVTPPAPSRAPLVVAPAPGEDGLPVVAGKLRMASSRARYARARAVPSDPIGADGERRPRVAPRVIGGRLRLEPSGRPQPDPDNGPAAPAETSPSRVLAPAGSGAAGDAG